MKRFTLLFALALLPLLAWQVSANTPSGAMAKGDSKKTVSGEVIDTGCYLAHEAHGVKHTSCATKCIGNGMPMGLLTSDGTVYLLTLSHDNADPYNKLKTMAGKNVSVTGPVMARGGMKAIEVDQIAAVK